VGRAVQGGLFFATPLTLFVVPAFYSIFNRHLKGKHQRDAQIAAVTMPGA
jgi:Cu/Ag efflux pump CusA